MDSDDELEAERQRAARQGWTVAGWSLAIVVVVVVAAAVALIVAVMRDSGLG
jgi:hypothetical protein